MLYFFFCSFGIFPYGSGLLFYSISFILLPVIVHKMLKLRIFVTKPSIALGKIAKGKTPVDYIHRTECGEKVLKTFFSFCTSLSPPLLPSQPKSISGIASLVTIPAACRQFRGTKRGKVGRKSSVVTLKS